MIRRINLVAAMVLCTIFSQAQQKTAYTASSGFGIRAGVNFQNINGKDQNGDKLNNDILTGFNAGITYDIPVGGEFYFQPGLLYTMKGAKNTDAILNQSVSSTIKLSYVELPLNFIFKSLLGTGHMLLGFGPYVALGVGGKVTYESNGISSTEKIKFQKTVTIADPDNFYYIRPMDAGANFLIGYEFSNKVSFQLNAQLGLLKINPVYEGYSNDQTSAMNTGFGFSLGYKF